MITYANSNILLEWTLVLSITPTSTNKNISKLLGWTYFFYLPKKKKGISYFFSLKFYF